MGGNLSFTADADSVAEPGKKSVVSGEITGVTADALFAAFEKYIRDGNTKNGSEKELKMEDKDGSFWITQTWSIPDMFGGGEWTVASAYKFDAATRTISHLFYPQQANIDRGEAALLSMIKVHSDPVSVEHWMEKYDVRASGRMLKYAVQQVAKHIGTTAEVHIDQPSIGDAGQLSVVSDPIEDGTATFETFLEATKAFLVDTKEGTMLPDGSIIEERSQIWDVASIATKTFAKYSLQKEDNHVVCLEFGEDESLKTVMATTHIKAHANPFRLEAWNIQEPGRSAGEQQLKMFQPFVEKVLKGLQEA